MEQANGKLSIPLVSGSFYYTIFNDSDQSGNLVFYIFHTRQNPNLKKNNLLLVWALTFIFIA